MKRILMTGDSITHSHRSHEDLQNRGAGYATLVAAWMGAEHPGEFEFLNTGISGDRVIDLLSRIKRDIINPAPDFLSILIGVNDVWHELVHHNGVSAQYYELYYDLLIGQLQAALPGIRIMILEPFLLKAAATEENWEEFRCQVELRAAAARRVAEKNGLVFVPLMEVFDQAAHTAPASYWLYDGVHPTAMGHELIKRAWLQGFARLEAEL